MWIIERLAPANYSRFIDVFGGSGTVLMNRPIKRGCMEVYNDYNSNLTNLFFCVKERPGVLNLSMFVRECFALSMEPQLQERMYQQFGERKSQFFLSDTHRRRWTHWRSLCWRLSDRNKAALYLLTAYESLWHRMIWKCGNDGFDFQAVHLRGIKPELYSVYQAAKAIAVGSCNITLADLASPELVTDEAFQLIICALLMAKYGDVVLNLENGAVKEGN